MTSTIAEAALFLSRWTELAVIGKATILLLVGLIAARLARRSRASVRHLLLAPLGQDDWPVMHLIVRARTVDPANLIPEVKTAVWSVDKNQPLPNTKTMTKVVADSVWEPRLNTVVLAAFAVVTLV